jgi:putative (di)nucleoside polyphosphate hydrolase
MGTGRITLMIDENGYRSNVGIVLANAAGQVLWARRVGGRNAWQFPQGGVNQGETPEQALYRELHEEVGLRAASVRQLGQTDDWLHYDLPGYMRRNNSTPGFVGQKQKWFLLQLVDDDAAIALDQSAKPEFDQWCWVSYYYPISQIIDFKREVYRQALVRLAPHLPVLTNNA